MHQKELDAVVVGSGPNGLAAAITLAQRGLKVLVLEAAPSPGGGLRTDWLTLPGFRHDVCAAIHPLARLSPFLRSLPLAEYGLEWIQPEAPLAHPLDGGQALVFERALEATAAKLGEDRLAYRQILQPFVKNWQSLAADTLRGFPLPPRRPLLLGRFGWHGIQSLEAFARRNFHTPAVQAALAGCAAHAMLPLNQPLTAGVGLILAISAHAVGWPLARGGSGQIALALCAYLRSLGVEVVTNCRVSRLEALPPARLTLLDLAPKSFLEIAGDRLPRGYTRQLERYRYGMGVCKVDYALQGPIPWRNPEVARAATVHLGGSLEEIAASEQAAWRGEQAPLPFVLLAQPSLFDSSRAPPGYHTAWAYCHVPHGSALEVTGHIEAQIERFAPGFGERVLQRHVFTAAGYEAYNPNYVGGDINCGVQDWRQFFTRPRPSLRPYATPLKGVYLCSSATPPGGGVHGMCGYLAGQAALRQA